MVALRPTVTAKTSFLTGRYPQTQIPMRQELVDFVYWLNANKSIDLKHDYGEEDVDEYLQQQVKKFDLGDVGGNEVELKCDSFAVSKNPNDPYCAKCRKYPWEHD